MKFTSKLFKNKKRFINKRFSRFRKFGTVETASFGRKFYNFSICSVVIMTSQWAIPFFFFILTCISCQDLQGELHQVRQKTHQQKLKHIHQPHPVPHQQNLYNFSAYDKNTVRGKAIKTICFHDNDAGERGTQVALYDYADYAEIFWNVTSIVFFPNIPAKLKPSALRKFQSRFKVVLYEPDIRFPVSGQNLLKHLLAENCDFFYVIKAGSIASQPSKLSLTPEVVPIGFHAVFDWQPHGSSYAAISPDVTRHRANLAVVPHMVRPVDFTAFAKVESFREMLKIPDSAIVLCRHGGIDTFDLPFVFKSIWKSVQKHPSEKLHFVFMNTWRFSADGVGNRKDFHKGLELRDDPHPQIHHIPAIVNLTEKESFFKTCNGMIHARSSGETFGLAVAEFSAHNLPVLTYGLSGSKEHLGILKEKAFLYSNEEELDKIIDSFMKDGIPERNYNGYDDFQPEKVMKLFKKYFLDPIFV
jgi:hypothetical protein